MKRLNNSVGFALGLNLLCPGLGHVYCRDALFGVFIFLVALLTSVVFYVSLIITLPLIVKLILFGLPVLFYAATFFDLTRTIQRRSDQHETLLRRHGRTALAYILIGIVFQLAAPVAPGNYLIRNAPVVFEAPSNDFSPELSRGELAYSSALSMRSDIFFLDNPVWHRYPDYGSIVRFQDDRGQMALGVVVGQPYDAVEIVSGVLFINDELQLRALDNTPLSNGELPLTMTDAGSILVVTLKLGRVDSVHQVPLYDISGTVSRLF